MYLRANAPFCNCTKYNTYTQIHREMLIALWRIAHTNVITKFIILLHLRYAVRYSVMFGLWLDDMRVQWIKFRNENASNGLSHQFNTKMTSKLCHASIITIIIIFFFFFFLFLTAIKWKHIVNALNGQNG